MGKYWTKARKKLMRKTKVPTFFIKVLFDKRKLNTPRVQFPRELLKTWNHQEPGHAFEPGDHVEFWYVGHDTFMVRKDSPDTRALSHPVYGNGVPEETITDELERIEKETAKIEACKSSVEDIQLLDLDDVDKEKRKSAKELDNIFNGEDDDG